MTVLSRGARVRRSGRRPGWLLLTALLVLAIAASSALVFTNRVELLKLAVILALWAAVVTAFVSVIYRRQSDVDQARARDLKLVYDLQLDREISARREYELTVESQLRRELASELRAQAADEVAALRAELVALRTNLEILFDTDLDHRPALETERRTVRGYSDWPREGESTPADWVNRVASVRPDEGSSRTDDSSIIDVSEVGLVPPPREAATAAAAEPYQAMDTYQGAGSYRAPEGYAPAGEYRAPEAYEAAEAYGDSHWQQSQGGGWVPQEAERSGWRPPGVSPASGEERYEPQPQRRGRHQQEVSPPGPEPRVDPRPAPPQPEPEPPRPGWSAPAAAQPWRAATEWQPVGSEGHWVPAGTPGSNWVSGPHTNSDNAASGSTTVSPPPPAATPSGTRLGRHSRAAEPAAPAPAEAGPDWRYGDATRRAQPRQSTEYGGDSAGPPAPSPPPASPPEPTARHRSADPSSDPNGPQTGGQSVADLLARLQTSPTGGGRRRRRED